MSVIPKIPARLGWLFAMVVVWLLVPACASKKQGPPDSRPEYRYVMPEELMTRRATPTPDAAEAEASVEEEGEKQRSWFGRLFSRDKDEEPGDGEKSDAPENGEAGMEDSAEDNEGENELEDARYRLKAGDTVYITLTGSGGLNEQLETVVDEQGDVKLRFIGAVKAGGRTTTELEREIEAEYTERQKIYKEVVVRVVVPNTYYFIGGEVRQPGRFPMIGRVTLSQAIVAAGNFTEWANSKRIFLVRDNERREINFRDIREDPTEDVELQPGDVITVDRSTF